jgi:hypothetical protein
VKGSWKCEQRKWVEQTKTKGKRKEKETSDIDKVHQKKQ